MRTGPQSRAGQLALFQGLQPASLHYSPLWHSGDDATDMWLQFWVFHRCCQSAMILNLFLMPSENTAVLSCLSENAHQGLLRGLGLKTIVHV